MKNSKSEEMKIHDTALLNINPVTDPPKGPSKKPVSDPSPNAPYDDPYGHDDPPLLDVRACSSMECTGLIPALPADHSDLESYAEIYHYPADIFHG